MGMNGRKREIVSGAHEDPKAHPDDCEGDAEAHE
jgi:hypothetical protein